MTSQPEHSPSVGQAECLPIVRDWFSRLTAEQVATLRQHVDDATLPAEVLDVLHTGPLTPMHITDAWRGEFVPMPLQVKIALETVEPGHSRLPCS